MATTIKFKPADRIADIKPYFFASLNQKIADLKARNIDVIRLDMGSPDLPPADFIIESLVNTAKRPNSHGYTAIGGTEEYRKAVSTYYQKRFHVELNPKTDVIGLIGSKEGLFNLSQAILNPGDIALVPDPGYPVYSSAAKIAGAHIYSIPLLREDHFLPNLNLIPKEIAERAKILWLNYPNNPTGAIAPISFLEKAVEFAQKYRILLAHDAPYTDVCFDGYIAPSILSIPGAKEVSIEFNSLAKAYNMAGWRLGMAVGNPDVIGFLSTYKSQVDSSHFSAILSAGITAMTGDQEWLWDRNDIYRQRRDICLDALRGVGFSIETPPASIYIWAHLPADITDEIDFCNQLLLSTGVSVTPGTVYGENGKGYIRISLGTPTDQIAEAMNRLVNWVTIYRTR